MRRSHYRKIDYLQAGQLFHWATKEHYILWLTGKEGRHKRSEIMLPRLVKEGKLVARKYGNRLIYSVPRRTQKVFDKDIPEKYREELEDRFLQVEHGLAVTEGLVRLWRSNMEGEIIPERYFRGLGLVPDFGIRYPSGSLLLYEHTTADNFYRTTVVKGKISRYNDSIDQIMEKFSGNRSIVVFVLDVPRITVKNFVDRRKPIGEIFMFTDYETFKNVPLGENLKSPIYIWGEDGESYPLTNV